MKEEMTLYPLAFNKRKSQDRFLEDSYELFLIHKIYFNSFCMCLYVHDMYAYVCLCMFVCYMVLAHVWYTCVGHRTVSDVNSHLPSGLRKGLFVILFCVHQSSSWGLLEGFCICHLALHWSAGVTDTSSYTQFLREFCGFELRPSWLHGKHFSRWKIIPVPHTISFKTKSVNKIIKFVHVCTSLCM